eukprot:9279021-Alexandrium_andersonii.AAC.1
MPVAMLGRRREPRNPHAARPRGLAEHLVALREVARRAELNALLRQAAAPESARVDVYMVVEAPRDLRPAPGGGRAGVLVRQAPPPRRSGGEGEGHGAQEKDVALPGSGVLW